MLIPLIDSLKIEKVNFEQICQHIFEIMKNNPKIEKVKMYPIFKQLSDIYNFCFENYRKVIQIKKVLSFYLDSEPNLEISLDKSKTTLDDDELLQELDERLQHVNQENAPNYFELKIQYRGYCPVSLVEN